MVTTLLSARFTRDVLVPGWILTVGLAALNAPVMGVAASIWLFVVGVVGVPALILISRPSKLPAPAAEPVIG